MTVIELIDALQTLMQRAGPDSGRVGDMEVVFETENAALSYPWIEDEKVYV